MSEKEEYTSFAEFQRLQKKRHLEKNKELRKQRAAEVAAARRRRALGLTLGSKWTEKLRASAQGVSLNSDVTGIIRDMVRPATADDEVQQLELPRPGKRKRGFGGGKRKRSSVLLRKVKGERPTKKSRQSSPKKRKRSSVSLRKVHGKRPTKRSKTCG